MKHDKKSEYIVILKFFVVHQPLKFFKVDFAITIQISLGYHCLHLNLIHRDCYGMLLYDKPFQRF